MVAGRGWQPWRMRAVVYWGQSLIRDDAKVLETNGGDGYTTRGMYLKLQNCMLRNGYDGKFDIVNLYHNLKDEQRIWASNSQMTKSKKPINSQKEKKVRWSHFSNAYFFNVVMKKHKQYITSPGIQKYV